MINLLLGFEGRISRMQFWIGMLITAAIELILMFVFDVPYFPAELKPASVRLIEFAIQLVTIYPTAAIVVKRLHDRNQPGFYSIWLLGLIMLVAFTNLFGLTDDPKNPNWLDWILGLCTIVIGLAFLFELGFRRGTAGENRFGPDPLRGPAVGGSGPERT
jgi:uncharacterized membrane protein YhaH (DUF805 family)